MNIKNKLINYFRAGYPGIAIQTTEEARALRDIIDAAKEAKRKVLVWSATTGLVDMTIADKQKEIEDTNELGMACRVIRGDTVYIFRDSHTWPWEREMVMTRAMKDLLAGCPQDGSNVVFLGSEFKPHSTFEKLVTVIEYTLPNKDDLKLIASNIAKSAGKEIEASEEVLRALGGLSTSEAENALALSFIENDSFDAKTIYREKCQSVKRSGLLEIIEADPKGLSSVGGLDELKDWISKRQKAYTPEAFAYGLALPKGIMLIGVPGTGKSLSAKAVGTALNVPTVKLDIGSMFNSLVGESEARMRDALKLCEAVSPCVLWIDEVDKGLAGASGSGDSGGGVTKRVFGTLISWQQECKSPVFIVATANNVTSLPPELLRKGRFDELFTLDLPSEEERKAILAIHLVKRNRQPIAFALDMVATASEGFTGSEIEAALNEAMFHAFDDNKREVTALDIVKAIERTVPLSVTAKEQIAAIRDWGKTRARSASRAIQTKNVEIATRRLTS